MFSGPYAGLSPDGPALSSRELEPLPSRKRDVEKAFQLAYFINPNRVAALATTAKALTHVEDLSRQQERRKYFQPRGARTLSCRTRGQLLQHLICVVANTSAVGERLDRVLSPQDVDGLLIRFVVELVRISARRNSFYVCLGISRILHEYSTAEAATIHDFLTQDAERVRDEAYFRYGKGLLFNEIRHRFGSHIRTTRQARGELRLCSEKQPSARRVALVEECLRLLEPWGTKCRLPESLDARQNEVECLRFTGQDPDDEHPVELNRMAAVLEPRRFSRLTQLLGLPSPRERLCIPRFFPDGEVDARMDDETGAEPGDALAYRRPSRLTTGERASLASSVREISDRRRRWTSRGPCK